jgi:WhiB family redox-sensing transcriptional regulator
MNSRPKFIASTTAQKPLKWDSKLVDGDLAHTPGDLKQQPAKDILIHGSGGTPAGAALPCQVHDPDLWFADAPSDLERAKALCGGCPARLACLTGAIGRRESAGVWGGQILDKGEIVTHKRPRGRPRNGSAVPRHHLPRPLAESDRAPVAWP